MSNFREVVGLWAIFGSSKKIQTPRTRTYHISLWSWWSGDSKYIICFAKNSNFAVLRKHLRISRNTLLLSSSRNLNISRNKLYIWNDEIKIFSWYFWWFGLSDKFPFRRYIIRWGNLSLSKIIGGGGGGAPRTAASFYSAKLCRISTQNIKVAAQWMFIQRHVYCCSGLLFGKSTNRLRSCGVLDIFPLHICCAMKETVEETNYATSYGTKNLQKTKFEAAEMILDSLIEHNSVMTIKRLNSIDFA